MRKKKQEEVVIRPAKIEDIPGILSVQKKLLLGNKKGNDIRKKGFLVYSVREEELKKIISQRQNFLLVAEGKEGIVGYALAYDLEDWRKNKPGWDKEVKTDSDAKNHLLKDRILYFRHIARTKQYLGIGKRLEEQIYALAESQGYQDVVGEILENPVLNEKSKEIHEQRGYRRIGQVAYSDGTLWGLYEKQLKLHGRKTLETALGLVLIGGLILSVIFFSSITGNAIIDAKENTQKGFGVILLIIGLVSIFLAVKLKKQR